MLVDLDHFKEINDTLGHHYGDVLLPELGPRLAEAVGPDGIVARLGGDEFAVVPGERTEEPGRIEEIAAELLESCSARSRSMTFTSRWAASIGIARFPLDGDDIHTLIRRADIAMYSAKEVTVRSRSTRPSWIVTRAGGSPCSATSAARSSTMSSSCTSSRLWTSRDRAREEPRGWCAGSTRSSG